MVRWLKRKRPLDYVTQIQISIKTNKNDKILYYHIPIYIFPPFIVYQIKSIIQIRDKKVDLSPSLSGV